MYTRGERAQHGTFVSVIIIDLVMSGDNAIIIGLAAAGLASRQKRRPSPPEAYRHAPLLDFT